MFDVPKEVSGFSGQLQYVDTCPNQPEFTKAFCLQHCKEAEQEGIPCDLREYTKYKKKCNSSSKLHWQMLIEVVIS